MIFAPAGTCTAPLRPTAVMRLPWMTTTELATGGPPLPSISVPPWMTSVCCCPCAFAARVAEIASTDAVAVTIAFQFTRMKCSLQISGLNFDCFVGEIQPNPFPQHVLRKQVKLLLNDRLWATIQARPNGRLQGAV